MASGTRAAVAMNTKTESKVNMPVFSGYHKDWDSFKFRFQAYLAKLRLLEVTKSDFEPDESVENTTKSNDLYYNLALCCEDSEFISLIMSADEGNGQQAWQQLIGEYEVNSPERKSALRSALNDARFSKFGGKPKRYFIFMERVRTQLSTLGVTPNPTTTCTPTYRGLFDYMPNRQTTTNSYI